MAMSVSAGIEEWVRSEVAAGKKTIVLPKGTHHVYAENGIQRTLHIANNNDGMKQILFDLRDAENLVIEGNGAELICHGHIVPFYLKNAKNVTIKNLTMDWEYPFFSQGEVVEVGKGYFDVRFDLGKYPVGIRDERLVFLNPDLPEPMDFNNINIIDPQLGRLVFKSWDEYGVGRDHTAEILEKGLVRIRSSKICSPLKVGHVAVFQYNDRSSPGFVVHRSENIRLEQVTMYHAAAFGAIFEGSRDLYVNEVKAIRRPDSGRWYTTHHDVMHFVECRGDIHLTNCRFEFQGDDDCNIHGVYRPVVRTQNNKTLVTRLSHFQQMGIDTLYPGDTMGFHDADTLELLGEGTLVQALNRDAAQEDSLTFKEPLPDLDWKNVVVTLRAYDTDVKIRHNHFSNHRARSLLIKTLGKVRIHDNYFNSQGCAIKIRGEASSWYEAGGVEDVEIYNNVFDQCNSGGFSQATFELHATLGKPDSEIPIHKNVRIHNNRIIQIFKPLMIADHVENLEFYDNEIIAGEDYAPWFKGKVEPPNIAFGPGVTTGRFQKLDD
ncbi:Alpha-1,3-galactosidase B [Pontiella desulfatans]|uniref:Alpha-1,3-galactosidase B n=1 Tax=Pontiella desulfatans TaxID=2750659 RepID=A0A6C2U4W0_PONDE|nr:hypothetical protein [Pontiella desulfatans]VGO14857.1 Alpha-1,3-galactosidase B [Pontiella desulfatans]